MATPSQRVAIRLVAVDPPFGAGDGILFGPQERKIVDTFVTASATTSFDVHIDVVTESDEPDFCGSFVHGRRGDRFLYLSWGAADGDEPFVMFARAKLKLDQIPAELLAQALANSADLVWTLAATNEIGHPASGTIHPPAASWTLATDPTCHRVSGTR